MSFIETKGHKDKKMNEDKEQRIYRGIKRRAEMMEFGEIDIRIKVQDKCLVLAEVLKETIKIG